MIITSIEPVSKKKIRVCLDNRTDFYLYKGEVKRYDFQEGDDITGSYQEILDTILIPRAKRYTMHLLEKQDRSVEELTSKLSQHGYPREAIDVALAYVESYHYTDDERLARNYVRYHQQSRSKMRIKQDLLKKGIDRELIDLAIEEEYLMQESVLIKALIIKKNYDREVADAKQRDKMVRFLISRGFQYQDIGDFV